MEAPRHRHGHPHLGARLGRQGHAGDPADLNAGQADGGALDEAPDLRELGHQLVLPLEVAGAGAQQVDDGEEDGEGHEDEAADAELKREGPMVGHGPIQPSPRR